MVVPKPSPSAKSSIHAIVNVHEFVPAEHLVTASKYMQETWAAKMTWEELEMELARFTKNPFRRGL